jgi:uncharacterized protein (DUF1697 family)
MADLARRDRAFDRASWYLALLRGINVGGNNIIPMAELRACFTEMGATDIATYIQSGNVLFDGGRDGEDEWRPRIERALSERFGYEATVVVRTDSELRSIVANAPAGFGTDPDTYRSDVIFLFDRRAGPQVIEEVSPRDGVDSATVGDGVVYFERLTARATQSRLSRIVGRPIYKQVTIRNWRTTTTLLAMLDERGG